MSTFAETFDYVIVGAGSAGCVLARRLSDRPDCRVLLLESGPPTDTFWVRTPAGISELFTSDQFNYRYFTEPEPELNDRRVYWPLGKGLGGSGAINGMVYVRGNYRDYEHWAELGNPGWSWKEVLPYFKRSESNEWGASEFHGGDGPMGVTSPAVRHPTAVDFIESVHRYGLPKRDDFNTGEIEGAGFLQATIRDGKRQSTYSTFIAPVLGRENLVVRSGAHVRRVLLDGRRAEGVEALVDGQIHRFGATREVIVCAGAVGSPHLLMLSGIGDGAKLQSHGIDTVVHSPGVGENLQDHFTVAFKTRCTRKSSYNHSVGTWRKFWHGAKYLVTKGGYLAMPSTSTVMYLRSGPAVDYADLQVSFRPVTVSPDISGEFSVDRESAFGGSLYQVRPSSRGEIVLRSADPMQRPAVVANYLSDPADIAAMVSGLRQIREILATEPIASRCIEEIDPGPSATTDEQLVEYMRKEGGTAFHPAGTCKMGSDPMAVVDARLRVHQVDGLRVADASIMPAVTSGNINATVIMIGEKAADLVLEDAGVSSSAKGAGS